MMSNNCHHLLDDLSSYLDGEASAALCAEIERHLETCKNCRVVVDTMNKTVLLYRDLPQPALPDDVRSRLFQSLDLQEFMQ